MQEGKPWLVLYSSWLSVSSVYSLKGNIIQINKQAQALSMRCWVVKTRRMSCLSLAKSRLLYRQTYKSNMSLYTLVTMILPWFENDTGPSVGWSIEHFIREKKYTPFIIMQASPLSCQEIQDHQWLPIAFWFGDWLAVLMIPTSLPFIILEKTPIHHVWWE